LVEDVKALVDAAKAFPAEAPASIEAAVASGAVKPLDAARLPKRIADNVEAMGQIPTDLASLGQEAMATLELVQALVLPSVPGTVHEAEIEGRLKPFGQ
jgi:hypothetical protein